MCWAIPLTEELIAVPHYNEQDSVSGNGRCTHKRLLDFGPWRAVMLGALSVPYLCNRWSMSQRSEVLELEIVPGVINLFTASRNPFTTLGKSTSVAARRTSDTRTN